MKRRWTTVFAVSLLIVLLASLILVGYFAWIAGLDEFISAVAAMGASIIIAPILHEFGHVLAAKANKMECVDIKCFCFRYQKTDEKWKLTLVSPFAPDQTQVLPKSSENMQKRATLYTLGGLALEGAVCLLIALTAIIFACFKAATFSLWGMLPYCAYLFILNAVPLEYPDGKTDAFVAVGLKKGYPAEKTMVAAMCIQGELSQGSTFSQIDEKWYFDLPQLCEDEPLFAVMLDLRYRYYLDKGDMENAAKQLNRLSSLQAYFSDEEVEKIAAELVYMHALNGDKERADECGKICEEFLKKQTLLSKRALMAYCKAFGKDDQAQLLMEQAKNLLEKQSCLGLKKSEENLLNRI